MSINRSALLIGFLLIASACIVAGKSKEQVCKAAATCYYSTACRDYDEDKESSADRPRGWPSRKCFFKCMDEKLPSQYVEDFEDLYDKCEKKRNNKAKEGKIMKCMLHEIKKGICDKDFPGDGYEPYYDDK